MKVTFEINLKLIVRWALGLLLVWASLSKLANLQDFYGDLLAYRLPLPDLFLRLVAMCLPWLELLCGLLLLANLHLEAAVAWSIVLFASFVLATGQAWARGLSIDCGCFNLRALGFADGHPMVRLFHSVWFGFFRALLLLAGSIYLWRVQLREHSEPPRPLVTEKAV